MSTIDVRNDGPLTLESLLLSVEIAGSPVSPRVLLTYEQMDDVYTEMQSAVRFAPVLGDGVTFSGMTLIPCEA